MHRDKGNKKPPALLLDTVSVSIFWDQTEKMCTFSSREKCHEAFITMATPFINETAWIRIPYHNCVRDNEAVDRGELRQLARSESMIRGMLRIYSVAGSE